MPARFVLAAMTVAVPGRKAKGESKMDEMTEKQEIVYNLRDAFNAAIEIANELNIDGKALEQAKQDIIWQIIEACPEADPGTFVELANGRWTSFKNIREAPELYVQLPDGRWNSREAANAFKILTPEQP
jgi:hypothetical protein